MISNKITFYDFLIPLIISGKKTITIRDKSESNFLVNSIVEVFINESNEKVCNIKILSIGTILFNDINQLHAQKEGIELKKLKSIIKEIYPKLDDLFIISFKLIE